MAGGHNKIITTTCSFDCGSRCLLKVEVAGGRVTRITTDTRPGPGLKACPRGLAQGEVVQAPDRLTQPLKRTGKRGAGEFEPVGWDEALDRVARELRRVQKRYGNEAIMLAAYSGSQSPLNGTGRTAHRFFSLFGGCTSIYGNASFEAATFSSRMTFGNAATGSSWDSLLHSRLILLWGFNPLETRFGCDSAYYLMHAKKKGARIICVDPRRSRTAKALADQWIPIRPGTDAALLIAMACVLVSEDLYDRNFVETHTVGLASFRNYLMGDTDGIAKDPRWAEHITGIPSEVILRLAREYAAEKPAALCTGWAPGRSAFGEQYHRAASILAALTGNIGMPGGFAGGGTNVIPKGALGGSLPVPSAGNQGRAIHLTGIYDALHDGGIKLLYVVGCNLLNQFLNINKGVAALKDLAFIAVHELFLTPTAEFADIVFPVTHFLENKDIGQPWMGGFYFIHAERALAPAASVKSDLAIFSELAERLGIAGYNDKTEKEWLREFVSATAGLPDYEEFSKKGLHEIPQELPFVAFQKEIADPLRHPFRTPSGKIEICSGRLAESGDPLLPSIPTWIEPWEGPRDPLRERYPIQLISPHAQMRVNSTLDNIPSLKKRADDTLWIHNADAQTRGISSGDKVRVFNNRGTLITTARVTADIMPGVASLDAGAWYRPDADGVDQGGSVNVLTRDTPSPGGAFPSNTCLVQIEKSRSKL